MQAELQLFVIISVTGPETWPQGNVVPLFGIILSKHSCHIWDRRADMDYLSSDFMEHWKNMVSKKTGQKAKVVAIISVEPKKVFEQH